jgi:hypothetical protein
MRTSSFRIFFLPPQQREKLSSYYPVNLAALQHQRIPTMASTSSSLSTYELCSQSVDPNLSDLERQVFLIIIYVHQLKFICSSHMLSRLSKRRPIIIKLTGKISSSNVLPILSTRQMSASIHSSSYTRRLSYSICKPGSRCFVLDMSGTRTYKILC